MSDLSKTVIMPEPEPEPDHPYAIPEDGPCHRGPLPDEANLLVLLEAARLSARKVLDVHAGDAATMCCCPVCKNAEWLIICIELGGSGISGELQMNGQSARVRECAKELAESYPDLDELDLEVD